MSYHQFLKNGVSEDQACKMFAEAELKKHLSMGRTGRSYTYHDFMTNGISEYEACRMAEIINKNNDR